LLLWKFGPVEGFNFALQVIRIFKWLGLFKKLRAQKTLPLKDPCFSGEGQYG
jgi:hypothetical protein